MVDSAIPEDIRRFIQEHVDSVELLEALLLIRRDPHRWDAKRLAEELRTEVVSAAGRLNRLFKLGFLDRDGDDGFRYAPAEPRLEKIANDLALHYRERRYTIINLIFAKPIDRIQTFADAFKLKKGDR